MRNESPVTNWEPPMSEKGVVESYAVIREALEKNNRGNVVNSLQNCVLALTHDPLLGGHIRRNLFNERLTIDCPLPWVRESSVISDTDLAFLQLHLERHYGLKAERCLPGALKIAATDNAFHPVRDRLRALRWNGVPRVRNALHHFLGTEVNDYHERCLRTFMLGAVKRVFQPGCKFELMLVLVGGQGAGKSTFLRTLAMEPDWFSDDLRNLSDKDVFHRLNGRWIIEMSEMVATANARSIEEIKAFLSRERDFCRLAYDRFGADHPRQCVFAGTTNRMDFLPMDRSGNRRFLPVQVDASKADCHILDDPEESRAYFEQMWAEIMAQYDSGAYTTYLSKAEEATLLHEQEAFAQEDTLAGRIYHYMDQFQGDKLCTMQIFKEGLDHMFDEPKAYETREIREIVDEGIRRGEIKGWRRYENNRRFAKYGRQRGWERMIPEKVSEPQQMAFMVLDEPDLPWKDEPEGQQSLPER